MRKICIPKEILGKERAQEQKNHQKKKKRKELQDSLPEGLFAGVMGLKLLGAAIEGFAAGYPPRLFRMLLPLSGVLPIGFLLPVIGDGDLLGEAAMIL